jgi:toxin ParE1/3/4
MSRLLFSPRAEQDLDEILDYIARDKPLAAMRFVERLREACRLLAENPELGERREDFGPGLRCFSVGNYAIVYRCGSECVEIARVASGYRDLHAPF